MQVTQITATRRRPLEQYGHVEISMVATLEDGAHVMNSAIQLRRFVEQATLEKIPMEETQQMSFPTKEAEEKSKPVEKAETKAEVKEEKKVEVKAETKVEAKTETKKAEKKEEKKVEVKKEKKVAGTPYDRSSDLHKKLMAEFLDSNYPNWKTTVLQKAKDASIALEGTSFLDAEGLIIPEFKEAFTAKMK